MTAEAWSFWIMYIAPILLKGRIAPPYYKNLLLLSEMVCLAIKVEISVDETYDLEEKCAKWVEDYERYCILSLSCLYIDFSFCLDFIFKKAVIGWSFVPVQFTHCSMLPKTSALLGPSGIPGLL
jgi:hypothetical protein